MTWDLITSLSLIFSIAIMWVQRKTIMELERDVWELEKTYKELTGKPYRYLHRMFNLTNELERKNN